MSKKTTQKNEVSWSSPPRTQEVDKLQGLVDKGADYSTPIRNSYARAEQNLKRSYQSPLGAYTTADVRDKSLRSQQSELQQSMGLDLSNAAQQEAQAKFGRQYSVAGLTQPQMYQSGSVTKTKDPWGTALGIARMGASLGMAFL